MSRYKTLRRCLLAALCLSCFTGIGQGWAVDTIMSNWAFSQNVDLTPQGETRIQQVIKGWGLQELGQTDLSTIMNSFQDVRGTMAITQASGNLNNLTTVVLVNQGTSPQSPLFTKSVIADNVIVNYSSVYSTVIGGGSFQGTRGILAVTQAAGNMNNISNAVGFSNNSAPGQALPNATLGNISASNNVYQNLGTSQASTEIQPGSFKGFSGIGSVVQTAGNMIQVSSHLSVNINQ